MDRWFKANRLTLNVKNMKYMIWDSKDKLKQLPTVASKLSINDEEISKVSTMKYLGMMIDENLEFTEHVEYIYRKSCRIHG